MQKMPRRFFGGGGDFDPATIEDTKDLNLKIKTPTMYYRDPEEVSQKIAAIILTHHHLKEREIKLSDTFHTLGFNILDKQEILFHIEKYFDIVVPYEDGERLNTVHDLT